MPDEILTVKQAAVLLQVSTKTLYDWVNIPSFPAMKIGNVIRIPRNLLINWVENRAAQKKEAVR